MFVILVISVIIVGLNNVIGAINWYFLLKDNEVNVAIKNVQIIFLISQFAKYLPGNVGQYFGRVLWSKENGIPVALTLHTILLETIWNSSVAACLGFLSLVLFIDGTQNAFLYQPWQLGIIITLLLLAPWLLTLFINNYCPTVATWVSKGSQIPVPKLSTAVIVSSLYLCSFFLMGTILYLQSHSFFQLTGGSIIQVTCLFSIAWITGFVTPGAPGGIGVREAMIVLLFSPIFGSGPAVGLGVILRVTTILGDALAFLMGLLIKHVFKE